MLGTTLGVKEGNQLTVNSLTAFGEPLSTSPMEDSFFTGKPHVGEMGYAFLFRAYRADQGKWQTADPLGYPDGWNNFAYVNNGVFHKLDVIGFKELSVVFNREFKKPNISYDRAETDLPLTVENQTENCLYILGQVVTDVQIQPSPLWVQKRLKSVGLNSINNIVDLTNYVLWEIGQPMHAFDYSKLKGNWFVVSDYTENGDIYYLKTVLKQMMGII